MKPTLKNMNITLAHASLRQRPNIYLCSIRTFGNCALKASSDGYIYKYDSSGGMKIIDLKRLKLLYLYFDDKKYVGLEMANTSD